MRYNSPLAVILLLGVLTVVIVALAAAYLRLHLLGSRTGAEDQESKTARAARRHLMSGLVWALVVLVAWAGFVVVLLRSLSP